MRKLTAWQYVTLDGVVEAPEKWVMPAGVVAGLFIWISAAATGAGLGLWTLLAAGVNAVAVAVLVLGMSRSSVPASA